MPFLTSEGVSYSYCFSIEYIAILKEDLEKSSPAAYSTLNILTLQPKKGTSLPSKVFGIRFIKTSLIVTAWATSTGPFAL